MSPTATAPAVTDTVTVPVTAGYSRDEIPPRCRKPRRVGHATTFNATVPHVTAEDAPVAFRVTETYGVREVRAHNGQLFTPAGVSLRMFTRGDEYRDVAHTTDTTMTDDELAGHVRDRVQAFYTRYLIIDGDVWEQTPEPRYIVTSFGFDPPVVLTSNREHESVRNEAVFNAHEFDDATAYANRRVPDRVHRRNIEVVIDSEVRLVTPTSNTREQSEARFAVESATRVYGDTLNGSDPAREQDAWERLCAARDHARTIGARLTFDAAPPTANRPSPCQSDAPESVSFHYPFH